MMGAATVLAERPTTTDPRAAVPVEKTKDLIMAGIKISVVYMALPDVEELAYLSRIDNRLQASIAPDPEVAPVIDKMQICGGVYKIIVDYGDTAFNGFVAVNGRTLVAGRPQRI
jgi:hypothetical protein